ncbi:MAG TPA: tRNA uridine-5-carboxymethylaminomethyl(34) synthesis GTPase MnmE [Candidatus Onthomonas avicola]|nr:tRNA uridine-5-carboxymethylaminomethyl(34) synthesis GTPase MnmE [Candidatus Onthomonas avicola]
MAETIAAIATGMVRSAVGILRLSGPGSLAAASACFTPRSGRLLGDYPPGRLVLGTLRDASGAVIDQCLATWSRAPHSYTGEETAEIQCHGSPTVLAAGLEALFAHGARQAEAGEFTKRAFLNGKLDLIQAEAVADLIDAETPDAARNAAGQLERAMTRRIEAVADRLTDLLAHFHAVLDYPDEDIDPLEAEEIAETLRAAAAELDGLRASYRRGRQLTEGIPCAIVGRPNAGKSSLLNALLGYERAIVTAVPGTTRDTVEERCVLGGVLLRLMDTAGLRETEDVVERLGVERSRAALARAELALVLLDGSEALTPEDGEILRLAGQCPHRIVLVSKSDLPQVLRLPEGIEAVTVSSVTGQGLEALEEEIRRRFAAAPATAGELITNARQAETVGRAAESLQAASEALAEGLAPDAVLSDVEGALAALGQVTGRSVTEEVTARIFQRFCVGK